MWSATPDDVEAHVYAQWLHVRAALRHLGSAEYWDGRGDTECAVQVHRNAVIEYAATELEEDRAALERRRLGPD